MSEGRELWLEQLYREEGARMWRAILAYSGDREVASDAVAEAFAQALRRSGAIRKPRPWVWRAAFRIAAGEMAGRARFLALHHAPETAADADSDPSGELMSALRRLTPMQRGSLVLHYFAGYRAREVAQILGSTSAAVRVHLSRGRRRLRELLEDDRE